MRNKKAKMIFLFVLIILSIAAVLQSCGKAEETAVPASSGDAAIEEEAKFVPSGTGISDVTKSETVTASGDATGAVAKVTVEATLSGFDADDGDYIEDAATLTDIKNKEGAEEYAQDGDNIYWQNLGEDITYEGSASSKLPVDVHISYYLDGSEKSTEEMKGASGRVTIRYDFVNTLAGDYVPFVAIPLVTLDADTFENVEVTNGKLMSFSGSNIAMGMVVPGLGEYLDLNGYDSFEDEDISFDDYVEITADATDFKLDFSAVIVKNGLLEDLEDEDLDDIDDLTDSLKKLGTSGDKLVKAAGKLVSGSDKFKEGLTSFADGVSKLADGISQLDTSLSQMDTESLKATLSAAMSAEKQQIEAAGGTYDAGSSVYAQLLTLIESMDQVKAAVGSLDSAGQQLSDSGEALVDGYGSLDEGISKFESAIKKLNKKGLQKMSDSGEDLADILTKIRKLKSFDKSYDNYGGKLQNQDCDVTFIIECDGI